MATVERTIADVLVRSGAELTRRAAEQALDRGLVSRRRLRAALAAGKALASFWQPLLGAEEGSDAALWGAEGWAWSAAR